MVYLFNYPAYSLIRPALEPRCPDNRGSTVAGAADILEQPFCDVDHRFCMITYKYRI